MNKFKYLIITQQNIFNKINNKINNIVLPIISDIYRHDLSNKIYSFELCKNGDYSFLNQDKIEPLDEDELNQFSKYESVFLKMLDRLWVGFGYQKRKDLFHFHLKIWLHIIKKFEINFVFFGNVPHEGFDYIIYSICKIKNIKLRLLYNLPEANNGPYLVYFAKDIETQGLDIYEHFLELKKNTNEIDKNFLSKDLSFYLEKINENNEKYVGVLRKDANNTLLYFNTLEKNHSILTYLKNVIYRIFNYYIWNKKNRDQYFESKRIINNFYKKFSIDPDLTFKYIYFPLHYQPEASSSPLGGQFVNQDLIVDLLSWAVNEQTYIYVKEHPRESKKFSRNISFYKNILKNKNVKLINKNFNSMELIKNSIAVATITGSVGWESIFLSKPVLLFGYTSFQFAPGVFKISNKLDILKALKIIQSSINIIDKNDLIIYLKAIEKFVYNVFRDDDLNFQKISKEDNDNTMAKIIVNELNKISNNK